MREPPPHLGDSEVLAAVREHWEGAADRVEHLPLGFGAHHWAAYDGATPLHFATYDALGPRHDAGSLEAAYAGAAALHEHGLDFVLAPLPASGGSLTVPLAGGALSCTPWRQGQSGGPLDTAWTATALTRLHSTRPPAGLPRWQPLVGAGFADTTAELTERAWGRAPTPTPRETPYDVIWPRSPAGPTATTTSPLWLAAGPGWPLTESRTAATSC